MYVTFIYIKSKIKNQENENWSFLLDSILYVRLIYFISIQTFF